MSPADRLTSLKRSAVPEPVRWGAGQFAAMQAHGLFAGRAVALVAGRVCEHVADGPSPRPLRWTRRLYRSLDGCGVLTADDRTELLFGEVYRMSAMGWPHMLACLNVAEAVGAAFAGVGWVSPGFPFAADDESEPLPDVAVYPGRPEDYTDIPDNPLLVVEVADSTLDRDTTEKAELYATTGVPDYWVVDVDNCRLLVFRDPAPLPVGLGATAYRRRRDLGPDESISPLAAVAVVRVSDLLP